jgi:hypothetical protein
VLVEGNLQAIAAASPHLLEDPATCRPYTSGGRIRIAERIASAERHQLADVRLDALLRDLPDHLVDRVRVGVDRVREIESLVRRSEAKALIGRAWPTSRWRPPPPASRSDDERRARHLGDVARKYLAENQRADQPCRCGQASHCTGAVPAPTPTRDGS